MIAITQDRIDRTKAFLRFIRQTWQNNYVAFIEHRDVVKHVLAEGQLTSRFVFMVTMSCAIAILGLLLSSPAVVIGAMLISPLMSPIMLLGFSLCFMDLKHMKSALTVVSVGVVMSIAISWLIVTLSPITDATPEILARTRPNLFDLLVAIFSGLAGGYAMIKRKGETIVGVAIATALMPPLAVVGFGLATLNFSIAQGAFMLFMTNLLAISLTVTMMAKFYGFGNRDGRKYTKWQIAIIVSVFATLSFPLGIALKDIAYQTYVTKMAKSTIREYFDSKKSRISMFNISFSKTDGTSIDTVILTQDYKAKAQAELKALLSEKTGGQMLLSLDQIVVAREDIKQADKNIVIDSGINSALQVPATKLTRADEMVSALKHASFFPTEYIKVDIDNKIAAIYARPAKGVTISTLRQFETNLSERYPGWIIKAIPPFQALPFVYFDTGAKTLNSNEQEKLEDIIWALHHWDAKEVRVVGFASSTGELESFNNASLAYRRANTVLQIVKEAGIEARPYAEYRSFKQQQEEKKNGIVSMQRVEIRLSAQVATLRYKENTAGNSINNLNAISPTAGNESAATKDIKESKFVDETEELAVERTVVDAMLKTENTTKN
ncbi:DUF389 domain-containing protein [Rickettsiales bacterium]|nr:DUF389 domain-containing protein [Rickettsiales bacterium]